MKKYSTKTYYDYARYVLENDTSNNKDDKDVQNLIKKVNAVNSGSEAGLKDFSNYAQKECGIKDTSSFSRFMKSLLKGAAALWAGSGILKSVSLAIESGYSFYKKIHIIQQVGPNSVNVIGYGWHLPICVIACFLAFVFYKLFMWLLKDPKKKNTSESVEYRQFQLKKIYLESAVLFNKINESALIQYFAEGDADKGAKNSGKQITGLVNKAQPKCEGLLAKIMRLSSEFIHKHKKLIVAILIVIGIVLSCVKIFKGGFTKDIVGSRVVDFLGGNPGKFGGYNISMQ